MPGLRFFDIEREIAERLGARVEMVMEEGLAPDIRVTALKDAVDA
jgi:predicted nucleotidyltransferase